MPVLYMHRVALPPGSCSQIRWAGLVGILTAYSHCAPIPDVYAPEEQVGERSFGMLPLLASARR